MSCVQSTHTHTNTQPTYTCKNAQLNEYNKTNVQLWYQRGGSVSALINKACPRYAAKEELPKKKQNYNNYNLNKTNKNNEMGEKRLLKVQSQKIIIYAKMQNN